MIKFKLDKGVELPQYETEGAAGMDIRAHSIKEIYEIDNTKRDETSKQTCIEWFSHGDSHYIERGDRYLIGTGLYPIVPKGYEIQVRPRSGVTLKKGLQVLNSPGTIDSDYRGELCVIVSSRDMCTMRKGDKIAQIVVAEAKQHAVYLLDEDSHAKYTTDRGGNGFGSTGE